MPACTRRARPLPIAVGCLVACCAISPSPAIAQISTPASSIFDDLFVGTLTDFTRMSGVDAATLVGVGATAAAFGHMVDDPVSTYMFASPGLDTTLRTGEAVGGARFQLAAAAATYAVGRFTARPAISHVGAQLVRAQLMVQMMTGAIKMSARRTRPDGTRFSFPSGHASVTFASATVLQRNLGWKVGLPAYAVAGYVSASRVQDKRHFLSDVTFGAALGILAGRTVSIGSSQTRVEILPEVTRGGGAVSLRVIPRHQ